uniref:D5-like helicase-primase n=1 Tax=Mimivirus LCMiAC02 TaxID=2506609 RepID=A0A481Z1B6_9VIRU|nr:MAG: D5-like helicase-primase [Mimivirus LCMiAC02]
MRLSLPITDWPSDILLYIVEYFQNGEELLNYMLINNYIYKLIQNGEYFCNIEFRYGGYSIPNKIITLPRYIQIITFSRYLEKKMVEYLKGIDITNIRKILIYEYKYDMVNLGKKFEIDKWNNIEVKMKLIKCISIKHHIWYEFREHRWREISKKLSKILKGYEELFYDEKFEELLDSKMHLLGFENGVYDFKMKCFRDGVPNDYITLSVGYDYEEFTMNHKYIKTIYEFISKILPNKSMMEYILTIFSTFLNGYKESQHIFFWTKNGLDGESIMLLFAKIIFGDYFGTAPPRIIINKQRRDNNLFLIQVKNRKKHLVKIQELNQNYEINSGAVKEFMFSDMIYFKSLHGKEISYQQQYKALFVFNNLPYISPNDGGIWKRMRVIDIDKNGLYDKNSSTYQHLKEKMEKLKGIFIWLLIHKYYKIYKKDMIYGWGVYEPEIARSSCRKYRNKCEILPDFLNNYLEVTENPKDIINLSTVYNDFKRWFQTTITHKRAKRLSRNEFAEYLENHCYCCKIIHGEIIGVKINQK